MIKKDTSSRLVPQGIPNITEFYFDNSGRLLEKSGTSKFKAQDNYSNMILVYMESGVTNEEINLINFTPKNNNRVYTSHWFYLIYAGIKEHIVQGESKPRAFSAFYIPVPNLVLQNNRVDALIENEITIVKRYGVTNIGIFNSKADLVNNHLANEELANNNAFAYVLSGVDAGFYQVTYNVVDDTYTWTLRDNVMNYGLEQKQMKVQTIYIQKGYANVQNLPTIQTSTVQMIMQLLTELSIKIDSVLGSILTLTTENTNTIETLSNRVGDNVNLKSNVKISATNKNIKVNSDGLEVDVYDNNELDTKFDKIEDDISDINTDITLIKDRVDEVENLSSNNSGRLDELDIEVSNIDERVTNIEEKLEHQALTVPIDNITIVRNDEKELKVSDTVLESIDNKVEKTTFDTTVEGLEESIDSKVSKTTFDLQMLTKLNKKPDGENDLIIGNKINSLYIDIPSPNEVYVVANEAEMLALDAKVGDICVIKDSNSYILSSLPASELNNWDVIASGEGIISINNKTGKHITLGISDIAGLNDELNLMLPIQTYEDDIKNYVKKVDYDKEVFKRLPRIYLTDFKDAPVGVGFIYYGTSDGISNVPPIESNNIWGILTVEAGAYHASSTSKNFKVIRYHDRYLAKEYYMSVESNGDVRQTWKEIATTQDIKWQLVYEGTQSLFEAEDANYKSFSISVPTLKDGDIITILIDTWIDDIEGSQPKQDTITKIIGKEMLGEHTVYYIFQMFNGTDYEQIMLEIAYTKESNSLTFIYRNENIGQTDGDIISLSIYKIGEVE